MAEGSVIGQSTVVRGNIRGEGSIEVYGRVEGDVIVTGDVTLGEQAAVRGSVSGARLTIGGTVSGDLTGTHAVVVGASAQVAGDLSAPRIGIAEGALVRGAVRTDDPDVSNAGRATRSEPATTPKAAPRPAARAVAPRSAPATKKKRPPAPVVPAVRRSKAKKKARRR